MSKQIVYTGGTFDMFHSGHVNFLKQCKRIAGADGKVVVSLNTDAFIGVYKDLEPVCNYEERKACLESCRYVDLVVENVGGSDSKPTILEVKPTIIVIGSDWAKKDYYSQMEFTQEWLDDNNIVLAYVPYKQDISTSIIKKRVYKHFKMSKLLV
jgi:glycerol-3-phosphate cytidylyltransferase